MVFSSDVRPIGIFLRIHMLEHASKNTAETQRNPLQKPSETLRETQRKNGSKPVKTCEWDLCENPARSD